MANDFLRAPSAVIEETEERPSLTYRLDLDRGRIVGKVNDLEAVNQAIKKAILTQRFKSLIYDSQYGSEIESALIAKDASRNYIEAAVECFVTDALIMDDRILSVYNFEIDFEEDAAHIIFDVETVYGETSFEAVI